MKIAFILRGHPGLGRVMSGVVLDTTLRDLFPNQYESLFFSSLCGSSFLTNIGYSVCNLYTEPINEQSYAHPFGKETKILFSELEKFHPDLVILDGEPLWIELVSQILEIPTMIIAPESDFTLEEAITKHLLQYYYQKTHSLLIHNINPLTHEQILKKITCQHVLTLPTFVRWQIFQEHLLRVKNPPTPSNTKRIVGVLGGGSENLGRAFWDENLQLAQWLLEVCNLEEADYLSLFCANQAIYEELIHTKDIQIELELMSSPTDNLKALLEADLIVGRAGIYLAAEILSLGCRGILVPFRSARSIETEQVAGMASQASPLIHSISLDQGFEKFRALFQEVLTMPIASPTWTPGNQILQQSLPSMI